jgi:L-fuculose-phosphate aldolase
MIPDELGTELMAAGRTLVTAGWVMGRGGNVSARVADIVYITARGAALDKLELTSFVAVDPATGLVLEGGTPSSELPMHLAAYRCDAAIGAVIHTHPRHAIACGVVGLETPALTPDFFVHVGERAPLVPYLPPGSPGLASGVAAALAQAPAVLLQNHGLLAVGRSVEQALLRSALVEEAAQILLLAHSTARPVHTLSREGREGLQAIRYALNP